MSILEDPEFLEYKAELESRENYTFLTEEEVARYDMMSIPPKVFSMEKAMSHPFLFAFHVIGIKPYDYQLKMMDSIINSKQTVMVTGRQLGKSTFLAMIAIWAVLSNAFPSGPYKDTKIMIISHTDNAAKKLLGEINKMLQMADERMSRFTSNQAQHEKNYFRQRIKKSTVQEIHFTKGSILVFPPTDVVRGNSVDLLIIDEAAKLNAHNPDYFFGEAAEPTTAKTAGKTVLTSTPGGVSGFFHDRVNPNDTIAAEGWNRIWYPWTITKEEANLEDLWMKRSLMLKLGNELSWKNEYEATFNSGLLSWIPPLMVDEMVKPYLDKRESYDAPVYGGLDFGDTHSRTTVFIVEPFVDDRGAKKVRLLHHKEFAGGYNNANIVSYFRNLSRRFNIKTIVADDCVGGTVPIQLLKDARFTIIPFQFSKQKDEGYELFKNAIVNGMIEMYDAKDVTGQIKALQSIELPSGRIAIRKPPGGRDDMCDGFMMAVYPFIQMKNRSRMRVSQ